MESGSIEKKLDLLREIIADSKKAMVAFSGGADSSFLLGVCNDVLSRENIFAITARSSIFSSSQLLGTSLFCASLGVKHSFINTFEIGIKDFSRNGADRCHFCKLNMYGKMIDEAVKEGATMMDGTNAEDLENGRPSEKAIKSSGVASPLALAGLTNDEIREASRSMGLPNWDKKLDPCLASKIRTGLKITSSRLFAVEEVEKFFSRESINLDDLLLARGGFKIIRGKNLTEEEKSKADSFFEKMGYKYSVKLSDEA